MITPALNLGDTKRPMPARLTGLGWILLAIGLLTGACAYAVDARRASFDNAMLLLFLGSLVAGTIFLIALEYITGAVWSVPVRRISEFFSGLAPLLPLAAEHAGSLPLGRPRGAGT
jgi:hypothetical protein